jgi:hypothetical protein
MIGQARRLTQETVQAHQANGWIGRVEVPPITHGGVAAGLPAGDESGFSRQLTRGEKAIYGVIDARGSQKRSWASAANAKSACFTAPALVPHMRYQAISLAFTIYRA